jgi:AraC-like DNA-binding protein
MQLAARRLEAPGMSVAQVGEEVGYESEAAFSRAFKKIVGMSPGSWRREHAQRTPRAVATGQTKSGRWVQPLRDSAGAGGGDRTSKASAEGF